MSKPTLFPYQQHLVSRLRDIRSVLVGDDVGLGKTLEAIALDQARRDAFPGRLQQTNGKTLVVCPLGVVRHWRAEFERFSGLKVCAINPRKRQDFLDELDLGTHDVYVIHWDVLRITPELRHHRWFHVIADEVHRIQSRKTKVTISLKSIPSLFRTGLSGTPAYAKPDDLWSVLNWLYPKFWRSYWDYFNRYILWVDYTGYKEIIGVQNEEELQNQLRGFYIRRTKEDVFDELPEKTFTKIPVDLSPKQRRAYNQMRDSMLAWVGEHEDEPINASIVLTQLTRLQQLASAHADITEEGKLVMIDPSTKLDAVMDIIVPTGRQIVVFSQFSKLIDLLCQRLENAKIPYGKYTGDVKSTKAREDIIDNFKSGELRVFAATFGAGGTGLDGLQVADTMIMLDRPWVQPIFDQAIGRLDRYGQKNAIQIIEVVAADTLETKRTQEIERSWGWVKQLLGDGGE